MLKAMEKTRTMVKIGGKDYIMAGFESEEYIHRVAIYVDRKMNELNGQYVNLNANTLSILTAINVADDLLKLQDEFEALNKGYQDLCEEIKKLKIELSLEKENRLSNVSSIKQSGKNQRYDGYK